VAHDMFRDIIATITLENGVHVQKETSHLFLAIRGNKWILSSLETIFEFWQILSLPIQLL